MPTPQTAIIPDHCRAAIYIEAEITDHSLVQAACLKSLEVLEKLQSQYPNEQLGLTIAFGADFWHSLGHQNEARELKNFRPLGSGLAPATQHDLLIYIQSLRHDINFELAAFVLLAFRGAVQVKTETHGFRYIEERGLEGFVDGTENPQGDEDVTRVGVIADGADAGGSYVLLQKYRHDLKKWYRHSLDEQEQAIGRSKADNEEFEGERLHPHAHIARVNLKEDGVGLKIVRRSLPFGTVTGEHGLMFIAFCARLHNIEQQLLSMFGESADGATDLLLERLSQAVSGAYYFAPAVERLRNL